MEQQRPLQQISVPSLSWPVNCSSGLFKFSSISIAFAVVGLADPRGPVGRGARPDHDGSARRRQRRQHKDLERVVLHGDESMDGTRRFRFVQESVSWASVSSSSTRSQGERSIWRVSVHVGESCRRALLTVEMSGPPLQRFIVSRTFHPDPASCQHPRSLRSWVALRSVLSLSSVFLRRALPMW